MTKGLIFPSFGKPSNANEANGHQRLMENGEGTVIGLVGGPGVGKNFVAINLIKAHPKLQYLYKVTTRKPRDTDKEEGVVAVPDHIFDAHIEHIVGVHKPFGDDDPRRYGWWVNGAIQGIKEGVHYIADPNIALIKDFRERFKDNLRLIGLTAEPDYLEMNMVSRRKEERRRQGEPTELSLEDLSDIERRVEVGIETTRRVQKAYFTGQIDSLIAVGPNNREHLIELVLDDLKTNTRFFSPEGNRLIMENSAIHHPLETINQYCSRRMRL